MFRGGPSHFRKISVNTASDAKSAGCHGNGLKKDLLNALETARCRLAIAIAEESRSTLWNRRKYYLDTADLLRRLIGKLDNGEEDAGDQPERWISALETLRRIPAKDGAQPLCKYINDIVASLK